MTEPNTPLHVKVADENIEHLLYKYTYFSQVLSGFRQSSCSLDVGCLLVVLFGMYKGANLWLSLSGFSLFVILQHLNRFYCKRLASCTLNNKEIPKFLGYLWILMYCADAMNFGVCLAIIYNLAV